MTKAIMSPIMDARDIIHKFTKLDLSKQAVKNISWSQVVQNKKVEKPSRIQIKGEIPYSWEIPDHTLSKRKSKKKNKKKNKLHVDIPEVDDCEVNMPQVDIPEFDLKHIEREKKKDKYQFFEIQKSLRRISEFGSQSNEAIEKRYRIRQQELKQNQSKNENSTSTTSRSTSNFSDQNDIVKIMLKKIRDIKAPVNEQFDKVTEEDIQRYKKNALITGLLLSEDNDYTELDYMFMEPTEAFMDSSALVANELSIINSKYEKESMAKFQINRFLEDLEKNDIIYHPLMGDIQKDPEYKELRLQRKAKEFIQSSRQFFMSIDNDSFSFESNTS